MTSTIFDQASGSLARVAGRTLSSPSGAVRFQAEAEIMAGVAQFLPARGFAFRQAALRDGDVDHIPFRLAQQAQRQPARNRFVIGMRREKKRLGSVRAQSPGRGAGANPPSGSERPSATMSGEIGNQIGSMDS